VTVVGSVGVLLAAIDAGKVSEKTADEWLSVWIDDIGYYVPLSKYHRVSITNRLWGLTRYGY